MPLKASPSRIPKYGLFPKAGRMYARCWINGRCHSLGPDSNAAKEKYHRIVAEWLASDCSPAFGLPEAELSVASVIAAYLQHCRRYFGEGPNSEWHRVDRATRPLDDLYALTPAADFGPLQLKAVREKLIVEGLTRPGVNAHVKRIVRMFRWAAGEALLPAAVVDGLRMVPGLRIGRTSAPEPPPIGPVDAAIVDTTLPHLMPIVADMVRFQRLTGCRPGEVCIVRPCDIDRSGDVWIYAPAHHKTQYLGRERTICVGPQGQALLRPYLLREATAYCFSPRESMRQFREWQKANRPPRTTPQYPCEVKRLRLKRKRRPIKQPGQRYDPRSYRQAIAKALRKAFPPPDELTGQALADWKRKHYWAPNQLRHAAATEIRKTFGLEAAQVVLGHAQANVTQLYAERDRALAATIAKQVG